MKKEKTRTGHDWIGIGRLGTTAIQPVKKVLSEFTTLTIPTRVRDTTRQIGSLNCFYFPFFSLLSFITGRIMSTKTIPLQLMRNGARNLAMDGTVDGTVDGYGYTGAEGGKSGKLSSSSSIACVLH